MKEGNIKKEKRDRRHKRVRSKIFGTENRPRLAVYRSNKALYGQLINDESGSTMISVRTDISTKKSPRERAFDAGKRIAEEAKSKKITKVVFDRGGFLYTGAIKSFAEGVRESGISF